MNQFSLPPSEHGATGHLRPLRLAALAAAHALCLVPSACADRNDTDDPDNDELGEDVGAASEAAVSLPCSHYVSVNDPSAADDSVHGTAAAPYKHINYAVNVVPSGAKVCVVAGIYQENIAFEHGHSIIVARVGSGEVVIDGTAMADTPVSRINCVPTISILGRDSITLQQLTITHHGNPYFGLGVAPPPNYLACTATGVRIQPIAPSANHPTSLGNVTNITISNCLFRDIHPARPDELGLPLGFGSDDASYTTTNVTVTGSTFTNNDTIAEESAGKIRVGAVGVGANVRDFKITNNTFDDNDSGGVETAGNQTGPLVPTGGLISNNVFKESGSAGSENNAAVYLQAARDIVVERNFFTGTYIAVSVYTEYPSSDERFACPFTPIRAGNITIRNNVMVGTGEQDFRTGANLAMGCPVARNSDGSCPVALVERPCNYQSVENVYFTNNTIYRALLGAVPGSAILVNHNSTAGLIGTNKILDNIIVTPGVVAELTQGSSAALASDYNYIVSTRANVLGVPIPFKLGATNTTLNAWRATGRDVNGIFATSVPTNVFVSPYPKDRPDFALSTTLTAPQNLGAPAVVGQPLPTTPPWTLPGYTQPELDQYGGTRDNGPRRDAGADER